MKRLLTISVVFAFYVFAAKAQLTIDESNNVSIANTDNCFYSLTIGPLPYGQTSYNIGVSSSVVHDPSKINVGVEGLVYINPSPYQNHGISGIAYPYEESTNGCFYGLTGIHSGLGSSGGSGILGSTSYSTYYQSPDIQGKFAGYFMGNTYVSDNLSASQVYLTSDMRLKENVIALKDIESGNVTLDKIMAMKVYEYSLKDRGEYDVDDETHVRIQKEIPELLDEIEKRKKTFESQRHYGVSAQELQAFYPNLVREAQDGYLSVNYLEMVPILIRGIQELSYKIKGVNGIAKMAPQSSDAITFTAKGVNKLFPSVPNPFTEKTSIRFQLADSVRDAVIRIFDINGKILKEMPVSSGMESVSVNGYELGEGMFLYSLLVDGQEIDTQKMILSK